MAWSLPSTRSTGYLVTAANWNELATNFAFLARVNITTFTSDVSITATTVGAANQIVSAGAITLENVPHLVEFFSPRYVAPAVTTNFQLRDGSTVLGTLSQINASVNQSPFYVAQEVTPTAASHTYNVSAFLSAAGTGTVKAGSGGAAGDGTTFLPGWIRITRVPT